MRRRTGGAGEESTGDIQAGWRARVWPPRTECPHPETFDATCQHRRPVVSLGSVPLVIDGPPGVLPIIRGRPIYPNVVPLPGNIEVRMAIPLN
jgi:hypothetical protein